MVISYILLIAIPLVIAFSLGILSGISQKLGLILTQVTLALMTVLSAYALVHVWNVPVQIHTSGFDPAVSINLLMGRSEAVLSLMINFVMFLGSIYLNSFMLRQGKAGTTIILLVTMALNGMIMTQDLFNLFVFMEISGIGMASLVMFCGDEKALSAGFKYTIATGLISTFLLLGIAFHYSILGTLRFSALFAGGILATKAGVIAVFLVLSAFILELKVFPANGWALDVYESAEPGVSALFSAASASAMLFVLYKFSQICDAGMLKYLAVAGLISMIFSNLLALSQRKPGRLLGYSSAAQVSLLIMILGLRNALGTEVQFILIGLLISHYFAKAGLFWLGGLLKKNETLEDWAILRSRPALMVMMGSFVMALLSLPPFPSFFAKWSLILKLADSGHYIYLAAVLVAAFLESVYLFRWLGYVIKLDVPEETEFAPTIGQVIPPLVFGVSLYVLGFVFRGVMPYGTSIDFIPLFFILALYLIDNWVPVVVKNTIVIIAMALFAWHYLPTLTEFRLLFGAIFMVGGTILFLPGYAWKGRREGFYPLAVMMYAGLAGLVLSKNMLQFFFAWELSTIGSYFLIIRGKNAIKHALSYILFSQAGAATIFAGFALAQVGNSSLNLAVLSKAPPHLVVWVYVLLIIGFLTKTATAPLHIWLPGAHAEAEADVSPMVSAILLKAGLFGLVVVFLAIHDQQIMNVSFLYILSWFAAITALVGNTLAAFQEDAKRLLAYSSVGQLGYAVFALCMMTHLGWLVGIVFAINHFMIKALLFLAVGGVIMRVHTHNMYEMGGLIKKMPLSFISVLIGIIALSGVPPLTGFGGKWIFFNAVIDKGWYAQGMVIIFSGVIAFLYLFRLVSTIFLGQLKDNHRQIKEAPLWMLVPQGILLAAIIGFSVLPGMILTRVGKYLGKYVPGSGLTWHGRLAHSILGYWDPISIIKVAAFVFVTVLIWLFIIKRKSQPVKQFNIVYAAERPLYPHTTHFAYNFYAPYRKALGFIEYPLSTKLWNSVAEGSHSLGDTIRRIYTGNGQTYVFHIVAYIVIAYLFVGRGL